MSSALRAPTLVLVAGVLVAAGALILAAASGPPYLSSDGVNGWIVLFATGLFAALLAVPFAIEGRLRARQPGSDSRWDRVVALGFVLLSG